MRASHKTMRQLLTSCLQFQHWLMSHGKLHGPHDFHSLQHYLALYVLARKLEIEGLQNQSEYMLLLDLRIPR